MTKEFARYFFMLITKDLQFSFDGMGLPNDACEWLENQLMQENFDKVEEFINKRYDERITNLTLELFKEMQKAQEPENEIKEKAKPDFLKICKNVGKKTKTREFRAMTNSEFCDKWRKNHLFCKSIASDSYCCPISPTGNCLRESFLNKPYIINGKYIMIEVTNDA